jgi:hypothetical protein
VLTLLGARVPLLLLSLVLVPQQQQHTADGS